MPPDEGAGENWNLHDSWPRFLYERQRFKDTNWQDGFTGFSFQWWQNSSQIIWYVSILIYQGKVFWCKIYVWRSNLNSCLQISISSSRKAKKVLMTLHLSMIFKVFQLIYFPSQIWLYIISQKKTRKCSTIAAERVFGMFLASCIQMSLTTWRGKITFLWSSHKIGVKKKRHL